MHSRSIPKLHPLTWLLIAVTVAVAIALLAAPVFSASANQCSSCHGTTYSQQLDIVEGNSQNKIPATIQVGQTQTVTVIVQNINNAPLNNQFSSVSLTLSSQNGHFSVTTPTYNVGTLSTGTATATWQIKGTSQGSDALIISASATNIHNNLKFSDSYSPSPSITVSAAATSTPAPQPNPTATPTPPTATPTTPPTTNPTTSPTTTQPPSPNSSPTSNPTQTPTSTTQPTQTPNSTDTSNTTQATSTPAPIDQPSGVDTTVQSSVGAAGTLTIVAPQGTQISWETSTQELTLNPNGATQPLTVNLKYLSTDGSNALSANTLALSWDAVGGAAPLKTSIEYQLNDGSGTWTTVAENILGDGSYTWTLPETQMNNAKMQISVSDSSSAQQNASAIADINIYHIPQGTAAWSISIYPSYIQMLELLATLIASAFYVKKMKTKRASNPTLKPTLNANVNRGIRR